MDRSTMFLSEMTIVDHAYIAATGTIIGGSWNPSFLVAGKIDPVEKVVVDFSTIKKQVKKYIDDDNVGFDHKLWVIDGFSGVTKYEVDGVGEVSFDALLDGAGNEEFSHTATVTITTNVGHITGPKNAFKFIKADEGQVYDTETAELWMAQYLNDIFAGKNGNIECDMLAKNEGQEIEVTCSNTINAHTYLPNEIAPVQYFTYNHGLKDSTSWGCQNLGHGHLSFIQIATDPEAYDNEASRYRDVNAVTFAIADALNNTTFINRENVTVDNSEVVSIAYETPCRGKFSASYSKADPDNKIIILDTETTIEFLVDYIRVNFAVELETISATGIYVSEGLSKGAYVDI